MTSRPLSPLPIEDAKRRANQVKLELDRIAGGPTSELAEDRIDDLITLLIHLYAEFPELNISTIVRTPMSARGGHHDR